MDTIVCDWLIVRIMDGDEVIGDVLWGTCTEDHSSRFATGDYICSSEIKEIVSKSKLIKTASGSVYQIVGKGGRAIIDFDDFELLRSGFSPEQIRTLNDPISQVAH